MQQHDSFILNHWNNTVDYSTTLIMVGDFLMGLNKVERVRHLLTTMPYRKFIWVLGNHDPLLSKMQDFLPFAQRDIEVHALGTNPVIDGHIVSHFPPNSIGERTPERNARYGQFTPQFGPEPRTYVHGHTHLTDKVLEVNGNTMYHVGWDAHREFISLGGI